MFDEEWAGVCRRLGRFVEPPYYTAGLLRLVAECHTDPIDRFTSAVRTVVREADSVGNVGAVEHHDVKLVIAVLKRVRRRVVHSGGWSETPAPPPMCG